MDEIYALLGTRESFPCFSCGAPCESDTFADNPVLQGRHVVELSPLEAHLALDGMGLPGERDCAFEVVSRVLTESKVVRVEGHSVPSTGRSVIDYLETEDGTRIYMSASTHGALVYRIRKPHRYAENTNAQPQT